MTDIYSKYDNMHKNGMFYALDYINNHVLLVKIVCYFWHETKSPRHLVDLRSWMEWKVYIGLD